MADDGLQFGEFLGILAREVGVFVNVGSKVVEFAVAVSDDEFPIALTHTDLRIEFPVEIVVLLLSSVVAEQPKPRKLSRVIDE